MLWGLFSYSELLVPFFLLSLARKKDSNRHHNLYPLYFAFIPCSLLGSIQDHVQLLRRAWDISSNHIKRSHKRPLTAVAKLQNVLRYTRSSSEFMTLGTKKGTEIVSYNRDNDTSQQETCILKNEISIIVGATCMNRRHTRRFFHLRNCLWFLPPKDIWSREEMRWWTTFTCQKAMPCNAMLWELVCILSHYFYILKVYWAAVIFLYCCTGL